MWDIIIIIIIVSLTIGYLECIFDRKDIKISASIFLLTKPFYWLATLVYLCAKLFGAPSVLFGFPLHFVQRLFES